MRRDAWTCRGPLLGAALCAVCGVVSPARAQDAPAESVRVDVAPDCASLEAERVLLEEIRVRLPEAIAIVREPDQETTWVLSWRWEAEGGCQLVLRDIEPVFEAPLPANATPARLREAAVRVAWFVSMGSPRPVEVPPVPEALPEIPPPGALDGERAREALPAIPKTAPAVAMARAPEPAVAATSTLTVGAPPRPSLLNAMADTLSEWKDSSPPLFGALERLGRTSPQVDLAGRRASLGLNLALTTDLARVHDAPAWLMAARAGLVLDERYVLGLAYQGLNTIVLTEWPREEEEEGGLETSTLSLHTGGVDLELIWGADHFIHFSTGLMLLGGRLSSASLGGEGEVETWLVMAELSGQAFIDLLPWLEAGLGVGYRGPLIQGNDAILGPAELRGVTGMFTVRLKVF